MAIAFEELEGSPSIVIGQTEAHAKREFRVAWSDWREFAETIVGGWKKTGATYRRRPPLEFPGIDDMVIDRVEVAPFDRFAPSGGDIESISRGTNAYPTGGASVSAFYKTLKTIDTDLQPPIEPGTYLSYTRDVEIQTVVTPPSAWVWSTDLTAVPSDLPTDLRIPSGRLSIGWDHVPSPPWTAIRELRGQVNDAEFFGAPSGRMMFLGARVAQKFEFLSGPSIFSIQYEFAERSDSWNSYFRPGVGFTEIRNGASGPAPYAGKDFHSLFVFET